MGATSSNTAGSTKNSGLPNITGKYSNIFGGEPFTSETNSAIYAGNHSSRYGVNNETGSDYMNLYFDASRSSSIYGSSNIVQPPAYYVYFWQRTA